MSAVKKKVSLTNLTPLHQRCGGSSCCPAVFKDEATGDLIIVGAATELEGKIGHGEGAVRIKQELLANVLASIATT